MNTATISEFVPTEEDFDILNYLTDLLYPLREFITILGAQHYPTLSFCLPLIYGLLNGTMHNIELKDKSICAFKDNLIPLLQWRFDIECINFCSRVITILLPTLARKVIFFRKSQVKSSKSQSHDFHLT